jgi:hypothetical protein
MNIVLYSRLIYIYIYIDVIGLDGEMIWDIGKCILNNVIYECV